MIFFAQWAMAPGALHGPPQTRALGPEGPKGLIGAHFWHMLGYGATGLRGYGATGSRKIYFFNVFD